MACHLTYIEPVNGVIIFDMLAYMGNMGVKLDDFDEKTKSRIRGLGELFGDGIKKDNLAEYLSGIAETIQYVEAAQQAKGKHLEHTHTVESAIEDIINSEVGVYLGLREELGTHEHHHEEQQHTHKHHSHRKHHHHH